jgi:hypothetical protein
MRQLVEYDTFKNEKGLTRREDLEAFGEYDLLPEPVELGADDYRRLDLFFSISRLRKPSESGIMPLGEEIKIWEALFKVELTELEIELIMRLDTQYRTSMGKELAKQSKLAASKPPEKDYDL